MRQNSAFATFAEHRAHVSDILIAFLFAFSGNNRVRILFMFIRDVSVFYIDMLRERMSKSVDTDKYVYKESFVLQGFILRLEIVGIK